MKNIKIRFKDWISAPRLRGDRLSGYAVYGIYLILIGLLSFPRRRESREWHNPTCYETMNCIKKIYKINNAENGYPGLRFCEEILNKTGDMKITN